MYCTFWIIDRGGVGGGEVAVGLGRTSCDRVTRLRAHGRGSRMQRRPSQGDSDAYFGETPESRIGLSGRTGALDASEG